MILIFGLGNPGRLYEDTRHNIGFKVLDALREKLSFSEFNSVPKFQALISEGKYLEQTSVYLVKPQTFMNKSGDCVRDITNFYKVALSNIWVIYDDIDLPLGTIRFRESGSAGTHNGMRSIVQSLGTENFPRFRIGIENDSRKDARERDLKDFVLHPFLSQEKPIVDKAVTDCIELIVDRLRMS